MEVSFELDAESRADLGKGATRRLRKSGKIPAIIYGGSDAPKTIYLDHNDVEHKLEHEAFYSHTLTMNVDGKTSQVLLRDIQRHPFKSLIMHMDFLRVTQDQKIHTQVPLHFIGESESPAARAGSKFSHLMNEVEINCQVKNLPEFIELDLSSAEPEQIYHLSDLKLPEGVELRHFDDEHDHAVVAAEKPKGKSAADDAETNVSEEESSEN